jgi:hypothetical protein
MTLSIKPLVVLALMLTLTEAVPGAEIRVNSNEGLRTALRQAVPGSTILIAPGSYTGGLYVENLKGTARARIVIAGLDPAHPPVFTGGGDEGWHFIDCSHVTLRHVVVSGYSQNGINADDGGSFATPSKGMRFEGLTIENTGPDGNFDALKLSGLDKFVVNGCTFRGWGGSAVDMVGCHNGVVTQCVFKGKAGFSQDSGIQLKGCTTNVLVTGCFFKNAGYRAINLGGSTGREFFRPYVTAYEAKAIDISDNRFVGGEAAVAWVTAAGGRVRRNLFYRQEKWVLRILQESTEPPFKPCHGGTFEQNLVVFDSRVDPFVNVGPDTRPESFVFRGNAWFQMDGNRIPDLPTPEIGGVYNVDPRLGNVATRAMAITSSDPRFAGIGPR